MRGRGIRAARLAALAGALVSISISALAAPPAGVGALSPAAPGFAQAHAGVPIVFPQDHGPHPSFRQEWWYVTGNLDAASGERFGFELTFFRFALAPPQPAAAGASAWRAREIYMAHFAITDAARARFRFSQKLERGALGLAGAQAAPFRVWLDDWSLSEAGAAPAAPAASWTLSAAEPGYAIQLELVPLQAPVLNGQAGLSRKSDEEGSASYYYSVPRLQAKGQLVRDGQTFAVTGLAWLDREWGSGSLGLRQAGWDWFALQLEDGSSLMFYALRTTDGGRDPHSAGTFVEASGAARPLANQDVAVAVTGEWRNAHGERYPARWHLLVPALALDLEVRPVLADQELTGRPPYWEGAVDVSGTRGAKRLTGRGYVELVGYAKER
jgi:predicted secreted hydrolase